MEHQVLQELVELLVHLQQVEHQELQVQAELQVQQVQVELQVQVERVE